MVMGSPTSLRLVLIGGELIFSLFLCHYILFRLKEKKKKREFIPAVGKGLGKQRNKEKEMNKDNLEARSVLFITMQDTEVCKSDGTH